MGTRQDALKSSLGQQTSTLMELLSDLETANPDDTWQVTSTVLVYGPTKKMNESTVHYLARAPSNLSYSPQSGGMLCGYVDTNEAGAIEITNQGDFDGTKLIDLLTEETDVELQFAKKGAYPFVAKQSPDNQTSFPLAVRKQVGYIEIAVAPTGDYDLPSSGYFDNDADYPDW